MRVEPVNPIYKSTFNKNPNPNKQNQQKKDGNKRDRKENPAVILEISAEGRKKAEEDNER